MRRSRRIDWLLLATLLPLYGATQLGHLHAYRASGERVLPFRISAQVHGIWAGSRELPLA